MTTRNRRTNLTAARLREVLSYNPDTGEFRWREQLGPRSVVGAIAGAMVGEGYWEIQIEGRCYKAHRLAWLHVHGVWPPARLDHKDTIRHHNWIDNLRLATNSQNCGNGKRRKTNTSGYKGVSFDKKEGKWRATIYLNYKQMFLGYFETPEAAHAAYVAKAKELFGEFANNG